MKKIAAFCPHDKNNAPYFEMMRNSLRKFHSEEELPLLEFGQEKMDLLKDGAFWYRATPILAQELLKEYETVIKLDADQIICGPLTEAFTGEFDVGVVNNANPKEFEIFPYQFLNIHPLAYVNNGFVIIRNPQMVDLWVDMCHSPLFNGFQMREQDVLNLLVHSNHYTVKHLDEGDSFWGLASKGYWQYCEMQGDEIVLPKADREWPDKGDKKIRVIHWAGGNGPADRANGTPFKMNYRTAFQPEVVKHLDYLVRP
jgi:hypothetical protein